MTDRNTHSQRTAAARAGFSERTARRFDADPTFPSQRQSKRGRTVADPLDGVWEKLLLPILELDSSVQAITLLRHLQQQCPNDFQDDRIRRTLERRVRDWRALHGPEKDIIFRQIPDPGYMCQSDFTDAAGLGVTISGDVFEHRLYHFVLVYSRWEYVGVVLGGESYTALAENLQNALWALGGAPKNCRTDSLSAAFRNLTKDEREDITKRYEAFTQHYGMEASRNNRGEAHENGAVESHHRHLKVAIEQALILRGSRDFETIGDYRRFLDELVARRNKHRADALEIELKHLQPLPARPTADFTETVVQVVRTGGFLVHQIFYSAPSRLIGQRLRVHIYDDRIEAYLGGTHVVSHPRARGQGNGHRIHVINYHHVIHALKRKPGALANSIYRDSLFPRTEYVLTWERLQAVLSRRDACRRMVDILFLAHDENAEVELANLMALDLRLGRLSDAQVLKAQLAPRDHSLPKDVAVNLPALSCFDTLLEKVG
jgi:hypothetical protein